MRSFYTSDRWRALRLVALRRDHYRCVICGTSVAAKGAARVDHILPVRTHPHLALDLANLRSLCTVCDAQSHREKSQGQGAPRNAKFEAIDCNGEPLDPQHHWNR